MADTDFETPGTPANVADRLVAEALIVDVDGFEGPLDLLLTLSRTQKVDLRKVSVCNWRSNIWLSWSRRRRCGWNWRPITLSWRRGWPF